MRRFWPSGNEVPGRGGCLPVGLFGGAGFGGGEPEAACIWLGEALAPEDLASRSRPEMLAPLRLSPGVHDRRSAAAALRAWRRTPGTRPRCTQVFQRNTALAAPAIPAVRSRQILAARGGTSGHRSTIRSLCGQLV